MSVWVVCALISCWIVTKKFSIPGAGSERDFQREVYSSKVPVAEQQNNIQQ